MRSFTSLSLCALAVSLLATLGGALADSRPSKTVKPAKSLAACTTFDQVDTDDTTVALTIHNRCSMPIDCSISWRLVCAPDAKSRRSVHAGTSRLSLTSATSGSTEASAAACKDDSWSIDEVRWSCQPNKD